MLNSYKTTKLPLMVVLVLSGAVLVYGQTAADIENLLDTREITFFQAAYVILAAALETPPESPAAAFNMARRKGWFSARTKTSGAVTMRTLSLLVMKAFNLKGGLLYRLFPGGRYAYREMVSRGFIEGRAYPSRKVSGEQLLWILGNVLAAEGLNDQ